MMANQQQPEQQQQQQQLQRQLLDRVYTDPTSPSSFEGIESVYREARNRGGGALNVTRKLVREYLQSQRSYTRHGQLPTRFPRNPIWSYCLNDCWFVDLHDVSRINWQNRRKKFLLIIVDALSRFLYCEPLKDKTADVTLEGLEKIMKKAGVSPGRITADAGSEFINNKMKQYMEREGIRLQIARAPLKASLAELMGKLLKAKMYRYMTHRRTKKYIDHLQEFVDSLNSRPLKSLGGLRPKDVTYQNQGEVYRAQLGRFRGRRNEDFRFEIGDRVRLAHKPGHSFTKGYYPSFSEEIYSVRGRTPQYPSPLYKLGDAMGNPILGRYYAQELHKVLP